MPAAPPHKKWTREERDLLEEAGLSETHRYELIEGELVLKAAKKNPHMRAVLLLTNWLRSVFGELRVLQEPSIDVSPEDHPTSEPEPDAVVLSRAFLEYPAQAPAVDILLVAEVSASTLTFDLTTRPDCTLVPASPNIGYSTYNAAASLCTANRQVAGTFPSNPIRSRNLLPRSAHRTPASPFLSCSDSCRSPCSSALPPAHPESGHHSPIRESSGISLVSFCREMLFCGRETVIPVIFA